MGGGKLNELTWLVVFVTLGCGGTQGRGSQAAAASGSPARGVSRADAALSASTATPSAAAPSAEPPGDASTTLHLYVVDVDQGDSTLLVGPGVEGRRVTLLMDAGDNRTGIDGSAYVGPLLEELGVEHLDYVVLSHYDADHMGGFVTIGHGRNSLLWDRTGDDENIRCQAKALFPRRAIFDVGEPVGSSRSRTEGRACVRQLAPAHRIEHAEVRGGAHLGRVISLGSEWTATVVTGGGYVLGGQSPVPDADSPNEMSISLLISNRQGFDFLVTGDLIGQPDGREDALLEPALAEALVDRGVDLEVLRIGHHGAANATAPVLLEQLRPEVAIISTGDNQPARYRHPRCATLTTCANAGVEVIQTETGRTDDCEDPAPVQAQVVNGDIEVAARGSAYVIRSRNQRASRVTDTPTQPLHRACSLAGCVDARADSERDSSTICCRVCRQGRPCGDSCISSDHACHLPDGCACGTPTDANEQNHPSETLRHLPNAFDDEDA